MQSLTRTFKDAIAVTRELGLGYIWIDSLCIVQDSPRDWEGESALMSTVYGNSTINLAAAGAIDGSHGLFLQPENYVGRVHIDVKIDGAVEGWDIANSLYYESVPTSPLGKRAWTLQERLLAPRTLYFSHTELFWECRELDARESFPDRLPDIAKRNLYYRDSTKSISDQWGTVVQMYTQANLTYPSDKLVAISGVARRAQEQNNDEYLAGMWRKGLEQQLCWVSAGRESSRPPPAEPYRAPT